MTPFPIESAGLFAALAGLFGLLIGSFLNVVVYRMPLMLQREEDDAFAERSHHSTDALPSGAPVSEAKSRPDSSSALNLVTPRSRCPACGHAIGALENVPVVSYLMLRGKCSACGAAIGARYPAIELLTALLSIVVAIALGPDWRTVFALAFVYFSIALTFIDIDTQLLPDRLTQPLLWLGLLVNLSGYGFTSLSSAVLGAAAGYLSLWLIYWAFKLATGKEGMGYGDFKLLAAIGAWVGWEILPTVILLSAVAGAVVGIGLMIATHRGKDIPIPFGPYLALAGVVALLWGPRLVHAYLGLFP